MNSGILGPLAQLVERLTFNQDVEGSNPSGPTILPHGGVAQLVRAAES